MLRLTRRVMETGLIKLPRHCSTLPERSTADAIQQCYTVLSCKRFAKWILEADIEGCFDNLNHQWLLDNIPIDKIILKKWLKAGYIESGNFYPTTSGTPQGGIISPLLANMALDGLGKLLAEKFPMKVSSRKPTHKVNYIRYADDCVPRIQRRKL